MAILGSPLTEERATQLMQTISTNIQELQNDLVGFLDVITEYADGDIEQIWLDANAADPSSPTGAETTAAQEFRTSFRNWQNSINNYVNNYAGGGVLLNNAFEIAKRANPRL